MNTLQESILDAISVLAENSIRNAPGTTVIDCVVSKIVNPGLGEYEVTYLGNTLPVYSSNPNIEFNIDDKVYVLIPEGDFSKQKIIISASTPSTITYDTSELNNYMQVSDNLLIDKDEVQLCSYETKYISVFEEKENGKFNVTFPKYLERYNTFAFSAKIKTSIPTEQQINGNYGLILKLPFYALNDAGEKIELWKNYVLDINNISGNPYRLTEWSNQSMFIQIDSEELYDIDRQPQLTAFVENFTQKENKPNDIFIKDISFSVYDVLTQENQTGYYLHLAASEGNYFFSDANIEIKKLKPTLKINGRNINLNNSLSTTADTYKCYWFKEDASIKANSEFYSAIGGAGWKCLNERKNVVANEDGSKSFDLVTNQYTYSVDRKNVLTSARYKCVIVVVKKNSDGTTLSTPVSSIIKLENLKTEVSMSVESKTGSNSYIKNIGKVNLISNIISNNNYFNIYPNYIITYEWNRYDKNGIYVDNDFYTIEFNSDKKENNQHKITQEISFETNIIENVNTFMCSAYINYIENGLSKKVLLGTESILINTNGTASYTLMIQNGDVLYKYDTDGDSPMEEDYDGPLDSRVDMIKPLTYSIYKADGSELTESEYAYCKAEWKVPKNSLLIPENKNIFDEYFYIENKIGRQEYVYKLASTYSYKKTDNTITLKVTFGSIELTADAPIKIVKEGDNGTNNSNYSAVITHYGSAYGERSDDIYQKFQAIYTADKSTWYYHNLKYRINNQAELKSMLLNSLNMAQPLEVVVYRSGQIVSIEDYQVEWSMFDSDQTQPCMTIKEAKENKCQIIPNLRWDKEEDTPVNIVQAKITITKTKENNTQSPTELYAYYPIEIIRVDKYDYLKRTIKDNNTTKEFFTIPTCINGFSSVLYASDGTNPQYNSSEPFTCVDAVFNEASDYNAYNWSSSENLSSIIVRDDNNNKIANQMNFRPRAKYDSSNSKNYVKAQLQYSDSYKETIKKLIDEQRAIYDTNIKLEANLTEEEKYLKQFLMECNFNSLKNYVLELGTEEFLANRVNILNATDELKEKLEIIINYNKEIRNSRYIFIKGLDDKCHSLLDRIKYIQNYITEVKNFGEELKIQKLELGKIELEFLAHLTGDPKNSKEVTYSLNSIRTTLEHYQHDFNEYLDTIYEKNRVNYLNVLNKSITKFQDIIDFYTQLQDSNNLFWLRNEILDETYKKGYIDLYKFFSALKQSLTSTLETGIFTQANILNAINRSIEIVSYYGKYDFEEANKTDGSKESHSSNILSVAKTNEINQRRTLYQENAAAAFNEIERLSLSLVDGKYSITYLRPIVMTFNRYELSAITGWDGNKLYTGEGNTGSYLYAPQVGAGKKEGDGSFTGIVIGNRRINNKEEIGLFGFYQGIETIKLDAETGSAAFGKSGGGQVIIDPSSNKAIIKSGNYEEKTSTKQGAGMQIDLTTPEIRFGSGNFVVNANGEITAKGGGSIAGWKITDTQLHSDVTETNGRITLDAGTTKDGATTYGIYSHNHKSLSSRSKGFYLSQDGLSIGKSIEISSAEDGVIKVGRLSGTRYWTIGGTSNDDDNKNYSYISYNTNIFNSTNLENSDNYNIGGSSGQIYIGTNGLRLGNKFAVDSDGNLVAKHLIAKNGGVIAGWEITSTSLRKKNSSNKGIRIKSNGNITGGVFIGDNWELDENNDYWEIKPNGSATFKNITATGNIYTGNGNIAGWKINEKTLTAKNITIDSEGSIRAGNKWKIDSEGNATFKNITCDSVWSFGSGNNIWTNSAFSFGKGTLGGNSIDGSLAFTNGTVGLGATGKGKNGISYNGTKCIIAGDIYANSGYFKGEVVASSLTIEGDTKLAGIKLYTDSTHYLYFAGSTDEGNKHPTVSGLNVKSGGIAMNGINGISNCNKIDGLTSLTSSGVLTISATNVKIIGGLLTDAIAVYDSSNTYNGTTESVSIITGNDKKITLKFAKGICYNISVADV